MPSKRKETEPHLSPSKKAKDDPTAIAEAKAAAREALTAKKKPLVKPPPRKLAAQTEDTVSPELKSPPAQETKWAETPFTSPVHSEKKRKGAARKVPDLGDEEQEKTTPPPVDAPTVGVSLRYLLPLVFLVAIEFFFRVGLDLPLGKLCRNMLMPPQPAPVTGRYECSKEALTKDVTIVVTVKDACSQAPGFIAALNKMVPPTVHLIYTYPNFSSCASIPGMDEELGKWANVTKLPLGLRVSPMSGWVDAVPHIKTKYALLLHNDGYALDDFFACELVGALKARANSSDSNRYVVSAPMLYESKADKSLAAHATQSNLRLVSEAGATHGRTVRHDHSPARALNRGSDFGEGPQSEFLEDHGFLIETDKIATVIDPHASYTLEYIDMIMTIRSNKWQVLFVPTARLEFRITEFSWRDLPYFMYKRSEVTCHGTRDYLTKKWEASFPNTGFWTYIKYTIVEQHVYGEAELAALKWKEAASIAFGFFQMAGFNRYHDAVGSSGVLDFISVLEKLDVGWVPSGPLRASRNLERRAWAPEEIKPTTQRAEEILGAPVPASRVKMEADMPLEYLPFGVLELRYPNRAAVPGALLPVCGLLVRHGGAQVGEAHEGEVSCWVNLPTFKSNSRFVSLLAQVAALIKLPSRVTTYVEMAMGSTNAAKEYLQKLEAKLAAAEEVELYSSSGLRTSSKKADAGAGVKARLVTCEHDTPNCAARFELGPTSQVLQFAGRPPSDWEVSDALFGK